MEAILDLVAGKQPKGRAGKPIAPQWVKETI
jgi:hypothetical protein